MESVKNKLIVSKDNQLIRASYELSLSEQRVILLCIANLDSRANKPNHHEFTISADDFSKTMGTAKENAYRDLKIAVNKLYGRDIYFDDVGDIEGKGWKWLYSKEFNKTTNSAVININPKLFPFLFELKKKFTSYRLRDVSKFKSSYSIRIYEFLIQYKKNNELVVEVDWLRKKLQLGEKYPRTSDIKKKIVIPAVEDINAFSNISVTYEQIKAGREISQFVFKYSVEPEPNQPLKKVTKDMIVKYARPGESYEDVKCRLLKNGIPATKLENIK